MYNVAREPTPKIGNMHMKEHHTAPAKKNKTIPS